MSGSKKAAVARCAVAAAVLIAAFVCFASFRPRLLESVKAITVNVTHTDGTIRAETLETNARYLAEAVEPLSLLEGVETEEGFFLVAVDGETADGSSGRYWAFYANGGQTDHDVKTQPVASGDTFDFFTFVY